MIPYIENRDGVKYEFKSLTRKQKINVQKLTSNMNKDSIEEIDNLTYEILKYNYPELTKEQFDDILDYNEETYGFKELYEMMGYILEDVFTQVGGNTTRVNPYLQYKREQKAQ